MGASDGIKTVDIVRLVKKYAKQTHYDGAYGKAVGDIGGFASAFEFSDGRVMGCTTDGVGAKLRVAVELEKYDTIGIDLVAMVANDLSVMGYDPATLQDYIAMGEFSLSQFESLISGVAKGCKMAGMKLDGGESANMQFLYKKGEFDLSACAVGFASSIGDLITGENIRPGMNIFGYPSSGIHSNGFTTAFRALSLDGRCLRKALLLSDWDGAFGGKSLGEELLTPTTIYTDVVLYTLSLFEVAGLSHITGGGILENVERILPDDCAAIIKANNWRRPNIFSVIAEMCKLTDDAMLREFNCGIGLVAISDCDMTTDGWIRIGNIIGLDEIRGLASGVRFVF